MVLFKHKDKFKFFLYYWLFVILLYAVQVVMVTFLPKYSGLIYSLSMGFAVCGALRLTELLLFPEIETEEILAKNPISYAIYIFAFAYIFASAMF